MEPQLDSGLEVSQNDILRHALSKVCSHTFDMNPDGQVVLRGNYLWKCEVRVIKSQMIYVARWQVCFETKENGFPVFPQTVREPRPNLLSKWRGKYNSFSLIYDYIQ